MKLRFLSALAVLFSVGMALAFEDRVPAVASSRIDGLGHDRILDTFVDSGGNTYVVGTFESSTLHLTRFEDTPGDGEDDSVEQVDQHSLNTAGDKDIFVAKYGASGDLEWARRAGGTGEDVGTGVVVDQDSNVFITGYFSDTATFGGSQLTAEMQTLPDTEAGHFDTDAGFTMGNDLFVAMLSSDGVWQWARKFEYTLRHERLEAVSDLHRINMVDDDGNQPTVSGYKRDAGWRYGDSDSPNYNQYGWQSDRRDEGSDDGVTFPLDEFIHTEGAWWRITDNIQAGWYEVETHSFDPNDTDSRYHMYASDTSSISSGVEMYDIANPQSGTKYKAARFLEVVPATNPTIYVLEGPNADNNKLNRVIIRETGMRPSIAQALGTWRLRSGPDDYPGKGLVIDSEGNLYLKGFFHTLFNSDSSHPDWAIYMDPPEGGSIKLNTRNDGDLEKNSFIVKFETGVIADRSDPSAWNWGWMEMMSEELGSETRISEVIVDSADRIVAGGNWSGTMNGESAASSGSAFVTRHFASTGNRSGFMRVDGLSASRNSSPRIEAIVSDSQSQIYVLGNFNRRSQDIGGVLTAGARIDFSPGTSGPFSLTTFGKRNLFLAKANANSNWVWAQNGPNPSDGSLDHVSSDIMGFDLALDVGGNLYVSGVLRDGPFVVGGQTLEPSNTSRNEPFVARVDVSGTSPVWETAAVPVARSDALGAHIQTSPTGLLSWIVGSGDTGFITENASDVRIGSRTGTANISADSITGAGSLFYQLDLDLAPAEDLNTTGLLVGSVIPIPPGLLPAGPVPRIKFFIGGSEITDWQRYIHFDEHRNQFIVVSAFSDGLIRLFNNDFSEELGLFQLSTRFPTDDDPPGSYQRHITGPNFAESKVELQPVGATHTFSQVLYTTAGASVTGNREFVAASEGWSSLLYIEGENRAPGNGAAKVVPVRTLSYTSVPVESEVAIIGEPLDPRQFGHWNSPETALYPDGFDPNGKTGFVANALSPYDGAGADAAYNRSERSGHIIPVNTLSPRGDLVVIWDQRDFRGINVAWPTHPIRYTLQWPSNPEQIIITSGLGSEMRLQGQALAVAGGSLPIQLNAGGPEFASDTTTFAAEDHVTGGAQTQSASEIEGTEDDLLYQQARKGFLIDYAIPVPGASFYDVTLHFAETQFTNVGQRRFDILLEGQLVEENFDPVLAAGANTAIQRIYRVGTADAFLNLRLQGTTGEAHIAAIEIEAAPISTLAVNCGGPEATLGGVTFAADTGFTGGAAFEDALDETGAAVLAQPEDEIYRTGRAGSLVRYALPTGDGAFDVTLHFSEREPPAALEPSDSADIGAGLTQPDATTRAATITLEGESVETDLVILESVGAYNTPVALTYPAVVTDGVLNLAFSAPAGFDEAQINAISVAPRLQIEQERLDPAKFRQARIYHQPDRNQPGYNPNEEHALLAPSQTSEFNAVFALRTDLNHYARPTSDPYVLLKFQDGTNEDRWSYKVYRVSLTETVTIGATDHVFDFSVFTGFAGKRVQPPYPLSILPAQELTRRSDPAPGQVDAYWEDHKGAVWARSAGQIVVQYYYPLLPDFWYDLDGGGNPDNVTSAPWLEFVTAEQAPGNGTAPGEPIKTVYNIEWPPFTPELFVGETLRSAKRGLPGIIDWAAAAIVYDDNEDDLPLEPDSLGVNDPLTLTARIIDSMSDRRVTLRGRVNGENLTSRDGSIDYGIKVDLAEGGLYEFREFPPHLKLRMRFDPINEHLIFRGYAGGPNPSTPIEMLNIMSSTERDELLALGESSTWETAVRALYALTRNPNGVDRTKIDGIGPDEILAGIQHRLVGSEKQDDIVPENVLAAPALTAGLATGTGYMTLAENNDPALGAAPVALHVIRIVQPAGRGSLRLILPDSPLDEKVTLRHSYDFGGDPSRLFFEWYYKPATGSARPTTTPDGDGSWLPLTSGLGLNSITIEGSGLLTLSDNWIFCRYRAADGVTDTLYPQNPDFSGFAGDPSFVSVERPMFVPGWIKRVLEGINPFEQRFHDFHDSATQTYITMLQQVGGPFEGAVALNGSADFLNGVGLLQLYQTVLKRGMDLSINGIPNQSHDGTNTALLLAASRIADLYMLLGNEAFADAQDPTLGFNAGAEGEFGTVSSSSFAFENVLPSLLSEELALLRGRDASLAGTELGPVFNRLYWNFSSGLEGEPAYALNYQITDVNGVDPSGSPTGNPDGFIRELDAATLFPQGHGDAWGHYLSAVKTYYRLLRHHKFNWSTRAEYTLISGVPHAVDYLDEVKFARAAAARARAGESIVDLTYREQYTADPAGQWQGYKDTQEDSIPNAVPDAVAERAWGVDEWARRSGQGALLDWVVANAILPEEDEVDATETQVNADLPAGATPVSQFNQSSIDTIDRSTVGELTQIAAAIDTIQDTLDQADQGLNPLGLHESATPFDVDPSINEIGDDGERTTHFEQIFIRAQAAVDNAASAFDHANGLTERLRQLRVDQDDFQRESEDAEFDFKNRLIEIFGYPYEGHIGPGKPYPNGYDGPDLYMYNYVDVAEVNGDAENLAIQEPTDLNDNGVIDFGEVSDIQNQFDTFSAFFQPMKLGVADDDNGIQDTIAHYFPEDVAGGQSTFSGEPLEIEYQLSTRRWAFHAEGIGERRSEGAIQLAVNNMVQAEAELLTAISNYGSLVSEINDSIVLLDAQKDLQSETIQILTDRAATTTTLNSLILATNAVKTSVEQGADLASDLSDGGIAALPKSIIAGLASGGDVTAPLRGLIKTSDNVAQVAFRTAAAVTDTAIHSMESAKEQTELWTDLEIEKANFDFETQESLKVIEQLMRNEVTTRLELFNLEQALRASVSEYKAVLAEGQRILQERIIARRRLAGPVQQLRYQDIAFRNFRNEALQRYKAAFDVAARYVYVAANVYDYETTLLNSSNQAGRAFMTNIVKQRSLGLFEDGAPVNGVDGLSDPMARMRANFRVLKGQLGFNNPQIETGQFSLRHELFRMRESSEEAWQETLASHVVEDLWALPEFRRYCRPFAPEEAGAQPGIVIEFPTTVTFGLNFFGWPLAGGDSSYDSANFATKILGTGLWFENYDGNGLANTPRAYLVPAGLDVQRSPTFDNLVTREFNVVDQVLPLPFPIGNNQLTDPNYIPSIESLDNSFAQIRRFSRFRAYHDDGDDEFPEDQLEVTTRLVGRSVWNTRWMLIIPGGTFLNDPDEGIQTFIYGKKIPGTDQRDGNGIVDIRLFFQTYAYSGL